MSASGNPFEGMPFFGDIFKMLGQQAAGQGPVHWASATQLAVSIATDGESEPNVDPLERMRFEQLSRVAELQVSQATGLTTSRGGHNVAVVPVTRTQWALSTIEAYRPLVDAMGEALARSADPASEATEIDSYTDPGDAWLGQLMGALHPMMLGMMGGSLVGHLATSNFGQYDLPVPRPDTDSIQVIANNLDSFGRDWELDGDDLRLWVCIDQLTRHATLNSPGVATRLTELLIEFASTFESDSDSLGEKLTSFDIDPASDPGEQMQRMFGDPEVLLGAVRSDRQRDLLPVLEALVAAVAGYCDHVTDTVGAKLLGSYGQVTEAVRRRRVEEASSDRFVQRLLGLDLTQQHYDRGRAFVDGVIERERGDDLSRMWADPANLPTPNELDAPGLWLARIDL